MMIENAPAEMIGRSFIAVSLTQDVAELDYDAYMSSPDVIAAHSDGRWPVAGFTLEEDRKLVAIHEADRAAGRAFAYTLLTPDRSRCVGCVYVNSLREYLERAGAATDRFDEPAVMVPFWLRAGVDLDPADVLGEVIDWLARDWQLGSVVFRALPAERSSLAALNQTLDRISIETPDDPRPYVWFMDLGRRALSSDSE